MSQDSKILSYEVRDFDTFVGMDISKKEIVVSMRLPNADKPVKWKVSNTKKGRARLSRKIKREAVGQVLCCYEAGVCGYVLQREMEGSGVPCIVVAPSMIPAKKGERVKTDPRDADKLSKYLSTDDLHEVFPPTPQEEGARDLCRAREAAVRDRTAWRHRVLKLLLRIGVSYTAGKKHWTQRHMKWLKQVRLEDPLSQRALDDALLAVDQLDARIRSLEDAIAEAAATEPFREAVGVLGCFRGIALVSAMTFLTEIYHIGRFPDAGRLMAYLGLVPSEHSSGEVVRRGPITKAGNTRARRILIEAGHHFRRRIGISAEVKKRREGQPAWAIAIADKAMHRLHDKYWRMVLGQGKESNVATVAVTRELVGFLWGVMVELELRTARTRVA
jgi:transposase